MNDRQDRNGNQGERRQGALSPLGALVPGIVGAIAKKHGATATDLIAAWRDIVGPDYARLCQPVKISGGQAKGRRGDGRTLIIAARRADALDLEFAAADITARVNAYLGPGAITKISIEAVLELPPAEHTKDPPKPPAAPDESGLDAIHDDDLRMALARLQGEIARD